VHEPSALDRLVAIDEIGQLKARRDRAVDTKDWDGYYALHAPHHYSHNDGEGRHDRDQMIAHVRRSLQNVDTAHHSHTPEIVLDSPTTASGIWAMQDVLYWNQGTEEHWLHGFGFYHETYEQVDGRWLFTSRQLRRTFVRTSPGAAFGTDAVTERIRP
jgi:hypothetical protein